MKHNASMECIFRRIILVSLSDEVLDGNLEIKSLNIAYFGTKYFRFFPPKLQHLSFVVCYNLYRGGGERESTKVKHG